VGGETEPIDAVAPAAGGFYALTLHNPLANAHVASTAVTNANIVGIDNTVTVEGDPNALPASVPNLEVWSGTSQVVLQNLNVSQLTLGAGSSQTELANSTVNFVHELGGGAGNGQNTFTGNTVTALGSINLTGNTPGTATGDKIADNNLIGGASILLQDDDGALLQGNTFTGQPQGGVALSIADSQHVTVMQNRFTLPGGRLDKAIRVQFVAQPTSATILNNVISTSGLGTGIFLNVGNAADFSALVQGNDLRGNVIGVDIAGDGSGAGAVDLGGGSAGGLGASAGGNDFRSYLAANVANGVFAIYLHNTGAAAAVSAQNNIWSVADPSTVIKDGTHNTNTANIAAIPGAGAIAVGATQLSADQQFVQTLYNDFLQRSGSVAELNGWVAQFPTLGRTGVANAIVRSDEALRRLVDTFYQKFLNRPADSAGETGWAQFLEGGGTEEQLMVDFLSSPEYYAHATALIGSPNPDGNFIAAMYEQLLGRPGTAAEISNWLAALPGLNRGGVATFIVNATEARTDAVLQLYMNLLHRTTPPSAAELANWVNSSLDFLSIEVPLASSAEFYNNG
jgi:hypothetical protein